MNESETKRPIRVGLFNFEPLRITGLSEVFSARGGFDACPAQLPALLHEPEFDILLVALSDVPLTCELLSSLKARQPRLRALVMGAPLDEESVIALLAAGAKGWLEETSNPDQILQALHVVCRGSIWAPRRVLSHLVDRALGGEPISQESRRAHFTERERDVLNQLVMARSNREIAHALSLREQTVKSYIARMMRKVGVDNRIALSMQAAEARSSAPKDR
jgi:DNA-binding NarL/FixJ family response regulator